MILSSYGYSSDGFHDEVEIKSKSEMIEEMSNQIYNDKYFNELLRSTLDIMKKDSDTDFGLFESLIVASIKYKLRSQLSIKRDSFVKNLGLEMNEMEVETLYNYLSSEFFIRVHSRVLAPSFSTQMVSFVLDLSKITEKKKPFPKVELNKIDPVVITFLKNSGCEDKSKKLCEDISNKYHYGLFNRAKKKSNMIESCVSYYQYNIGQLFQNNFKTEEIMELDSVMKEPYMQKFNKITN